MLEIAFATVKGCQLGLPGDTRMRLGSAWSVTTALVVGTARSGSFAAMVMRDPPPALDPHVVSDALRELTDWELDSLGRLRRRLEFRSFTEAVAFLQSLATLADGLDHHPDVDVRWRTVHLVVSTHDAGGALTERDLELARGVERLVTRSS